MIIGEDVYINEITSITRPDLVKIGNHVAIDFGFVCTTGLVLGDYIHISPHVSVIGGKKTSLILEDFCFISTGSRMICGSDLFQGDGLIGPIIPEKYQDKQILEPINYRRTALTWSFFCSSYYTKCCSLISTFRTFFL